MIRIFDMSFMAFTLMVRNMCYIRIILMYPKIINKQIGHIICIFDIFPDRQRDLIQIYRQAEMICHLYADINRYLKAPGIYEDKHIPICIFDSEKQRSNIR